MDWPVLAWAMLGLFGAGVVKGGTGLGYATCALPFVVPAVGLKPAMMIVLAPAIASNFDVVRAAGHLRETWSRFWPFYLASLPGIACGVIGLSLVDAMLAVRILGGVLIAYVLFAVLKPQLVLRSQMATRLQGPAGFVNGVVTGLTGSQVMPLLPFMLAQGMDNDRFVQAVNLSVLVSTVVLAAALVLSGTVDADWLAVSLVAVVPALAGVRLGTASRRHLSAERFRQVVLAVLLAMGLLLLMR